MTESTQDPRPHLDWDGAAPTYGVPVPTVKRLMQILEVAHENTKELTQISNQKYAKKPCLRIEREIEAYVQDKVREEIYRILETLRTELGIEL